MCLPLAGLPASSDVAAAHVTTISVLAFHADPSGHLDSSTAFSHAVAYVAAHGGGNVDVPRGVYRVGGVYLKSNVHVHIAAGAVLRMPSASAGNTPMFYLAVKGVYTSVSAAKASITNVAVEGTGGSFVADLSHAPSVRNHFLTAINVNGFTVANVRVQMNNSNRSGAAPSSYAAAITYDADLAGVSPRNGSVANLTVLHAPYGFGALQVTSGVNLRFSNIRSLGGVALRFETDGGFPGRVAGVTATNIRCVNGHAAVMFAPHTQANGAVSVQGVVARSCSAGVRLDRASSGGTFIGAVVSGGSVTAGDHAQNKDPTTSPASGGWLVGPSEHCISNNAGGTFHVRITGVSCIAVH